MTYRDEITDTILKLHDRKGSSLTAIRNVMKENRPTGKKWANYAFISALKAGVLDGDLIQTKSSYRLAPELRRAMTKALLTSAEVVVSKTKKPAHKAATTSKKATAKSTSKKVTGNQKDSFSLLEGASKHSDVDTLCLLVPKSETKRVHAALVAATKSCHKWSVATKSLNEDIVKHLSPSMARVTKPLPEFFPDTLKSEEEILGVLLTGQKVFVTKYVLFEIEDDRDKEPFSVAIEITDEKYMKVYERALKINANSEQQDDCLYVGDVKLLERSEYKKQNLDSKIKTTASWVKKYMKRTESLLDEEVDLWEEIFDFCKYLESLIA